MKSAKWLGIHIDLVFLRKYTASFSSPEVWQLVRITDKQVEKFAFIFTHVYNIFLHMYVTCVYKTCFYPFLLIRIEFGYLLIKPDLEA